MRRFLCILGAGLMVATLAAVPALAASFPTKPINVLCVFGPGGSADLGMRVVAEYATQNGFPMNVVNKPGGGGSQSALEVAKARPDGYTLLFTSSSALSTLPLMKNAGYTIQDFAPVADVSDMPLTFCARTDSGLKSFVEWMDKARAEPGKYNYGSPGSLTSQLLFMTTLLKKKFPGVEAPHVPYQSGHEVNTALLGNHIKAAFGVPGTNKNYLQSGDFTLLATSAPKRLEEYPNAPTFAELYGDEFVWVSYHGVLAPKKTPKAVVDAISGIIKKALADPAVIERFKKIGITADYKDPAQFGKLIMDTHKFVDDSLTELKLK